MTGDPMVRWLGMPVPAAAHAGEVDQIMSLVHWLMLALFVGWSVFFVYVLVRFRRGRNPVANYGGMRARWATWVEGGVLAAEITLIAFFSVPVWSARVDHLPPEDQSTVVRVAAEQFAWNVHYPGADGIFGPTHISLVGPDNPLGLDRTHPAGRDDITTINRLNLPVNTPVIVMLSTKDVVHSFGLPQMRIKQDATPGVMQPVWFTPIEIGEWDIACSQLCGLGHFRMKGVYAIQPREEFEKWLAQEAAYLQ